MKLSKCHFFAKEIQYLGHILGTMGIRPLPLKTHVINNMHPPKTAKQVQAFLGHVGYYRKFIKNFSRIAKPLTLLTHSKAKFKWTPAHHAAFMTLKETIIQSTYFVLPLSSKEYIVYMDAWGNACGAQLSQEHNETKLPVALLSYTFTETQRKMGHPRTGSLWNILCYNQMKLLPPRI